MTTARILAFPLRKSLPGKPSLPAGDPVSPFHHLMPRRPLTAAQLLHRRRMLLNHETHEARETRLVRFVRFVVEA